MEAKEKNSESNAITRISQVTPEVTLFLRGLGFSNYYIIKIYALVGEAAIALTEDNPYWLLDEFPNMRFATVDKAAESLGLAGDSVFRLEAAIKHNLAAYTGRGHTYAPVQELALATGLMLDVASERVRDVMEDMALSGELQMTVLEGREVVYFYGYYRTECQVAGRLAQMNGYKPKPLAANIEAVIRKAEQQSGLTFSAQQRQAIRDSLKRSVCIITGGPGTGKTTIINALIRIMEESGLSVAVAAPTGRAAKRITQTSGKQAQTIHRLLEYYYDEGQSRMAFGRNAENPLDYDAVIIDEASMMDLLLAGALCRALKEDSRLIITGDADQLPSVGAGNVLADLIESGYIFTARLTEIFRQAEESAIVVNAHRIRRGQYPQFGGDFQLLAADKQSDILEKIVKLASSRPLEQVQVLTPVKKGILGSVNLNARLQEVFNPRAGAGFETSSGAGAAAASPAACADQLTFGSSVFRLGDRVMQTKNDYRLEYKNADGSSGKGIFNGETGIVTAIHAEEQKLTVCYDGERWAEYEYLNMDEIELAYAVTVHKSQGSEFPVVIMPMSWFPPVLATRNLLYTAVTRGKQRVIIVGSQAYLNAMVDNNEEGKRNSGLALRLKGVYEGLLP